MSIITQNSTIALTTEWHGLATDNIFNWGIQRLTIALPFGTICSWSPLGYKMLCQNLHVCKTLRPATTDCRICLGETLIVILATKRGVSHRKHDVEVWQLALSRLTRRWYRFLSLLTCGTSSIILIEVGAISRAHRAIRLSRRSSHFNYLAIDH